MTVRLQETAVLSIAHDDLAAILSDHFCESYTPFRDHQIWLVDWDVDEGRFNLTLRRKLEQPASDPNHGR